MSLNISNKGPIGIRNDGPVSVANVKHVTNVINNGEYISDGQKKEILELADKLAEYKRLNGEFGKLLEEDGSAETKKHNAAIVGKSIGACRKLAMKEAKSAGPKGATTVGHIPACDFGRVMKKLNQLITYAQSGDGAHLHDDFQKDLIKKIQARRRNPLGISDEKFDLYLLEEYGAESITTLSYDELKRLKNYTYSNNPSFISTRQDDAENAKRAAAMADWIDYKKVTEAGFNPGDSGLYKFQVFAELQARYPGLFTIAVDTFEKFWKLKAVKAFGLITKTGKPPSALSAKYAKYILTK